ncbi:MULTISPECIES: NAD(P)/FAD-dependent oxidoreductase [unclassified Leuconostoc]|uniref:NAD(P)/FAD-dependent oxidoreductase n=1 Tax=unclassified Leuconostoc TaxID=2685106 RepID=UPI001908A365|nr:MULTISPECIES: NAD(P)/FAD-dependent oxidoreductase [unclassified Leuconostoc]MBK0041287.1 NAD(P)-binding domain-containing protein [Leuconostoc sp. S51]MBK0051474.1 NAD(P)-binding domain-containing protein [Leuconostoc sp. S50]
MESKIIIIGAGAAGIGLGVTLKQFGVDDVLILEKGNIGQSFKDWSPETHFITPSFTSNGFGMPDLNAISLNSSPAYSLGKERLSGKDYANYLSLVAGTYNLSIMTNEMVDQVVAQKDKTYQVVTKNHKFRAKYVIFAVGQFNYPYNPFDYGVHYTEVRQWHQLTTQNRIIIGGNESAFDAAINLARNGVVVDICTKSTALYEHSVDPSVRLSAYTSEKYYNLTDQQRLNIRVHEQMDLQQIQKLTNGKYRLIFDEGNKIIETSEEPIICTGFYNGATHIQPDLFKVVNNVSLLNDFDESIIAKNVFLTGPDVRHGETIFCYVYKFRQRFAIIAEEIMKRERLPIDTNILTQYKHNSFYIEDCSKCEVRCDC